MTPKNGFSGEVCGTNFGREGGKNCFQLKFAARTSVGPEIFPVLRQNAGEVLPKTPGFSSQVSKRNARKPKPEPENGVHPHFRKSSQYPPVSAVSAGPASLDTAASKQPAWPLWPRPPTFHSPGRPAWAGPTWPQPWPRGPSNGAAGPASSGPATGTPPPPAAPWCQPARSGAASS